MEEATHAATDEGDDFEGDEGWMQGEKGTKGCCLHEQRSAEVGVPGCVNAAGKLRQE